MTLAKRMAISAFPWLMIDLDASREVWPNPIPEGDAMCNCSTAQSRRRQTGNLRSWSNSYELTAPVHRRKLRKWERKGERGSDSGRPTSRTGNQRYEGVRMPRHSTFSGPRVIESAGNDSGSLKKLASSKITAFGLKQRLSNSLAFITVLTTMSVASVIYLSTFSSNRRGSRPAGVEDPTGLRDLSRASSEASKAPTVWLSEELLHLPQVIARRRDSSKMYYAGLIERPSA
ncbi:hypothetical protein NYO67_5857 [Aspergillus flavus]|nr:hypothetical protein NYO67_5857 [Aspergillus flavus]